MREIRIATPAVTAAAEEAILRAAQEKLRRDAIEMALMVPTCRKAVMVQKVGTKTRQYEIIPHDGICAHIDVRKPAWDLTISRNAESCPVTVTVIDRTIKQIAAGISFCQDETLTIFCE